MFLLIDEIDKIAKYFSVAILYFYFLISNFQCSVKLCLEHWTGQCQYELVALENGLMSVFIRQLEADVTEIFILILNKVSNF